MGGWKRIWPQKFRNRLFAAVVIFLLLPFFLLQIYNYRMMERTVSREFQEKAIEQLNVVNDALNNEINKAFLYYVYLERDPYTRSVLLYPGQFNPAEKAVFLQSTARPASLELPAQITVTLADRSGTLYRTDGLVQTGQEHADFASESGFAGLGAEGDSFRWVTGEDLSMYAVLLDNRQQPFGYLRINFYYDGWLAEASQDLLLQQHYVLMDQGGQLLNSSDYFRAVDRTAIQEMIRVPEREEPMQRVDYESSSILTISPLYNLDWYLAASMPLNTYLGNMKELREQNFNFSLLLSGGFLLLTFLIAGAMSRPIALLRRKMALSAQGELNTRVEESFFHGEMRDLAATFNTMMTDIGGLLQKLKLEERQKEALHYQMLTAQMNPHFLLNTLNTIKWIAYEKEEHDIAEISISLGKLLETSLYSDVELIPLQNELDLLQAYVYIQNIRYEGKVRVTLDVEEGLAYALVPKLALQPLMENAFKHGFSTLQEDSRVSVRARRSGRTLILELEDNGVGLARAGEHPEIRARKGIGIANIRQRLQLLFREDGSLVLLEGEKGTMARITIPLLIANPFQSGGAEHVENSSG